MKVGPFFALLLAACGGGTNDLPCGIGQACLNLDLSTVNPDLGGLGYDLANSQSPLDFAMSNNPPPDFAMNNNPPPDFAMNNNPPDLASSNACAVYTNTSIATMRQNGTAQCAALDGVVAIALHASTASPRLYVQDAAGGDYSAIDVHCSATSTAHPCTNQALVNAIAVGHAVAIHGQYTKSMSSGVDILYLDSISDKGVAGSTPAPLALVPADVARGALNAARWYQRVIVTITGSLVMYDWTPAEFVYASTAVNCHPPFQFGFGMIPSSVTPSSPAGMACSGTTAQPTGVTTPDSNEILNGLLLYDTVFGTTGMGYQYVAPQSAGDAAITNLM
jgi:hypothetical protein